MENRQHYHFVVGTVIFQPPGEEQEPREMRLNGYITTEEQKVPAKSIGQAQQVLQIRLMERLQKYLPSPPQILDVTIENIIYLGQFATKAEFFAGTQAQEKQQ